MPHQNISSVACRCRRNDAATFRVCTARLTCRTLHTHKACQSQRVLKASLKYPPSPSPADHQSSPPPPPVDPLSPSLLPGPPTSSSLSPESPLPKGCFRLWNNSSTFGTCASPHRKGVGHMSAVIACIRSCCRSHWLEHLRVLLRAIQCAGATALWLARRVKRDVCGGLLALPDRGPLNISTARLSVAKADAADATMTFAFC